MAPRVGEREIIELEPRADSNSTIVSRVGGREIIELEPRGEQEIFQY